MLATLTAEGFKTISDRVEKGEKALDIARELLKKHFRVVFNGNGARARPPHSLCNNALQACTAILHMRLGSAPRAAPDALRAGVRRGRVR